jgi:hypothetical protein
VIWNRHQAQDEWGVGGTGASEVRVRCIGRGACDH